MTSSIVQEIKIVQEQLRKQAQRLGQLNLKNNDYLEQNQLLAKQIVQLRTKINKKKHLIEQQNKDKMIIHQKLNQAQRQNNYYKFKINIKSLKILNKQNKYSLKQSINQIISLKIPKILMFKTIILIKQNYHRVKLKNILQNNRNLLKKLLNSFKSSNNNKNKQLINTMQTQMLDNINLLYFLHKLNKLNKNNKINKNKMMIKIKMINQIFYKNQEPRFKMMIMKINEYNYQSLFINMILFIRVFILFIKRIILKNKRKIKF